jgi:hypothetical protein
MTNIGNPLCTFLSLPYPQFKRRGRRRLSSLKEWHLEVFDLIANVRLALP